MPDPRRDALWRDRRESVHSIATWWVWAGFAGVVLVALAIDFLVLQRAGPHRVRTREALL